MFTAGTAAQLVGINKNTEAYYFYRLHLLIFYSSPHLEMFDGEIEADESYFGGYQKVSGVAMRQGRSPYSGF